MYQLPRQILKLLLNQCGRAVDDNTAYVFNVTKLEEFVPSFKEVGGTASASTTGK